MNFFKNNIKFFLVIIILSFFYDLTFNHTKRSKCGKFYIRRFNKCFSLYYNPIVNIKFNRYGTHISLIFFLLIEIIIF